MEEPEIRERIHRLYMSVSPGGRPPREDGKGELDSMAFLQFIAGLETEFDFVVDVTDLDDTNFKTTDSTARYVQWKLGQKKEGDGAPTGA